MHDCVASTKSRNVIKRQDMLIQNPDMLWTNNACVVPYSINKSNHDGFDVFASEAFLILGSQDNMHHQEQQALNQ